MDEAARRVIDEYIQVIAAVHAELEQGTVEEREQKVRYWLHQEPFLFLPWEVKLGLWEFERTHGVKVLLSIRIPSER